MGGKWVDSEHVDFLDGRLSWKPCWVVVAGVGGKCVEEGRGGREGSSYAFPDCMIPIMGWEEGRQDPRTPPGWGRGAGQPLEPSSSGLSQRQGCRVLRGYLPGHPPVCSCLLGDRAGSEMRGCELF